MANSFEETLLPRRFEVLLIIREHKLVTFDQIHRRFYGINPRTLHYDLEDLMKKGFVVKKGATRGAFYSPKQVILASKEE